MKTAQCKFCHEDLVEGTFYPYCSEECEGQAESCDDEPRNQYDERLSIGFAMLSDDFGMDDEEE